MNQYTKPNVDINGTRFKDFIRKLLRKGKLVESSIETIVREPDNMKKFLQALTAPSVNSLQNYEVYEFVGDAAGSNFLAFYFLNKFPQLDNPVGVQILSRLKIKFGSKSSYSNIARDLGFGEFIRATDTELNKDMKKLLEDCLEAMIGAIILVVNSYQNVNHGIGNDVGYFLLESAFNELKISIKYEEIVDATTRFKEMTDFLKVPVEILQESSKNTEQQMIHRISIKITISYAHIKNLFPDIIQPKNKDFIFYQQIIGTGESFKKKDALEMASVKALKALADNGIAKEAPQAYRLLGVPPAKNK